MKKMITLMAVMLLHKAAANAQSCCSGNADFQALAMTTDFKASHDAPLPLEYTPAEYSSMIEFATTDGKTARAFYVPSNKPNATVLVVFHEWWGLNDYIKQEAEKWQKILGNVDVYAPDMFDGRIATTADSAAIFSKALTQNRGDAIVKGLLAKIGRDKQIATIGWCMGGSWAFTASVAADKQAAGCVMYYGFPEKDARRIKPLNTDVLYVWASRDKHILRPFVDEFGQQVKETGHKFELHVFDADHAFANPSNPGFQAVPAVEAQTYATEFLKEHLHIVD